MLRTLTLLLLSLALVAPVRSGDRPPNLVFILADDLGYGELGCFGSKLIQTPNLDRMAAEGLKLTRFYAGSPVCAPSRSVLMTGLHTGHTRVRGNAGKQNADAQNLRPEDVVLPELLKKVGYHTALIGKWGLGAEGSDGVPNKKGFDYFYGYLDQEHAHNPYPDFIMRNAEAVKLRNKIQPGSEGSKANGAGIAEEPLDYVPDLMAEEALKWVKENKEAPFFLFWSLITPHANNQGTKYGRGQEVPDLGPYAARDWDQADKAHAATITRLDADVGRMLALLKELGLDDQTLVVFTGDNGHHKEGGNHPDLFDANGPFRGLKRDLYEGGFREPTIARWHGTIPPGSEDGGAYWFADVLPSFAQLAGAKDAPAKLDGDSTLALLLQGAKVKRAVRPTFYWEFHEGGFSQAVIMDERWKAIRLKRRDAHVQLYDLIGDVGETKDVADAHPDLVTRAKQLFETEHTDSPDWPIRDAPVNAPAAASEEK